MAGVYVTGDNSTLVWNNWTVTASSTTVTVTATWNTWVDNATTAMTTLGNAAQAAGYNTVEVWQNWQNGTANITFRNNQFNHVPPETEEQRRAREQRQAEAARLRKLANERAMELLLSELNEEQKRELAEHDYFTVRAESGALYEVQRGRHLNVFSLDEQRRRSRRYCITEYREQCPDADVMLAQKLMLETHEDDLKRIANVTVLRAA